MYPSRIDLAERARGAARVLPQAVLGENARSSVLLRSPLRREAPGKRVLPALVPACSRPIVLVAFAG